MLSSRYESIMQVNYWQTTKTEGEALCMAVEVEESWRVPLEREKENAWRMLLETFKKGLYWRAMPFECTEKWPGVGKWWANDEQMIRKW